MPPLRPDPVPTRVFLAYAHDGEGLPGTDSIQKIPMQYPLPPDIVSFATTNLPSVEELRVLVVFVEGRERWHNADTIAKTLHISDTVAQAALDHLARRNLLDIRVTDDVRYRFRPGTPLLESQATAVVATYRRNPRQILKLIN